MKKPLTVIVSALALAGTAEAALVDRGGGMIYDTTLNVTWLADMNYAFTSGYAASGVAYGSANTDDVIWNNGQMGWTAAKQWADGLAYGGFDDWRLPTLNPSDTSCSNSYDPGNGLPLQYFGYNCTGGELSHLFVTDLGTKPGQSVLDQAGDTAEQIANQTLFSNLQSKYIWSSTEEVQVPDLAWIFHADSAGQVYVIKSSPSFALAVRTGDVAAPIPEPATLALTAAAILGAAAARRRRPAQSAA